MNNDGYFDDQVAATYDAVHGQGKEAAIADTCALLAELADGGSALEFAIGTGRIALPLMQLGVPVKGIELSAAMVEQMRRKDGGRSIDVKVGDMTTQRFDEAFALVFLVYNTIDNLTTQDAQLACFQNAVAQLQPGGRFVIETLVPQVQKLGVGQSLLAFNRSDEHWGMDEIDVVTQTYSSHHMRIIDGKPRALSIPFRYAWPAEMDLMAKVSGMALEHRWSDWQRAPFTATSESHISVWRKTDA